MKTFAIAISLCSFLFAGTRLNAQTGANGPEEDRIVMRDGREFRGEIMSQIPDSVVVLEMIGGSKLVLAQRDILEIVPSPHRFKRVRYYLNRDRSPIVVRNHGFSNSFGIHFYPRRADWGGNTLAPGMYYSLNYRINHFVGLGLGAGLESYEGGALMPLFVQVSGDAHPGRITPSYYGRAGYGVGVAPSWRNSNFSGGLMFEGMAGVKYRTRSRLEWVTGIGFRYQSVQETPVLWAWPDPGQLPVVIDRVFRGMVLHYAVNF